ncbi:MAG: ISAs1 family transposase [Merismopedia sp. SIO2A8]|nr:ISAs1 family transposase [Symploca sp. SIO2B6]NET49371.1 ISAs1 family transposase [Merismopedia sp. SIO2A8]
MGDVGCLTCSKKTVEIIIEGNNDYCIGLKGNQPNLLKAAQDVAQTQQPSSEHTGLDTSKGRIVERCIKVFEVPWELQQQWSGLQAFAQIERVGEREGQKFDTESWVILSRVIDAQQVADLVQEHRGSVENRLHWVKDVVQIEDGSLVQSSNPATTLAFMRTWAISAFRRAGHDSITNAIRLFAHDLEKLFSFL